VTFVHQTVLLREAVELLKPGPGKVIVDGTLGGGGHAEALLEAGAQVVGYDKDPRAIDAAAQRLARFKGFRTMNAAFSQMEGPVDGVLLDLGVSSPQLDVAERGFSFNHDGPLDMRMGNEGETAAELIDSLEENALADVIYQLGDERFSRRIAKRLKALKPKTTFEAVEAVKRAVPRKAWPKGIHVATRTFQALRIAVNHELEELQAVLQRLPTLLNPGGRAAIISFHSLEDRMVKHTFRELDGFTVLTKKPITSSDDNPRARSAKLRGVEKNP
jgi:16S rRNA (cytosine1402-N4)-methyltransferase